MKSSQLDAYMLMHEGALALAQVETHGIRIDTEYLDRITKEVGDKQKDIRRQLQSHKTYRLQHRRNGGSTNITSRKQLAEVLSDLGYTVPRNEKGNYTLDESVLSSFEDEYCNLFLEYEKLNKLHSTYLKGIASEVCKGYLHPSFNLHLVKTFRSSSDSPNFQNIPIRNREIAAYIRRAFIPRDGHVLCEIDYGALEFKVGACFWKDPAMVSYASDPDKDIHRDCASKLFLCPKSRVSKDARYCGKNMFVFPQLYGDFFLSNARDLWAAMTTLNLGVDDKPMKDWLLDKDITKLGTGDPRETIPNTYEWHVKQFEKEFYDKWFPVLKENRDRFWEEYKRTGYFDLMTGFRIAGVYKRNFVLNAIIQGPAFHLLLWSLIQLVKWTRKNKTRTKIVGQIHDSIIADVHKDELDDYLAEAKRVMTEDVKKHYDWVITPLLIEAEVAETNWHEKKEIEV